MEFNENPSLDDNDYDINSSLPVDDVIIPEESDNTYEDNNIYSNFNPEEWEIEEDIFEDDNIAETLKKYNYDYKSLMRELTTFIDYSKLLEILNECGIKKEEYLNPTYVTFEKIRNKIINGNQTIK